MRACNCVCIYLLRLSKPLRERASSKLKSQSHVCVKSILYKDVKSRNAFASKERRVIITTKEIKYYIIKVFESEQPSNAVCVCVCM